MGVYLSIVRPPIEVAVDALSGRLSLGRLNEYLDFGPEVLANAPLTDESRAAFSAYLAASQRELYLAKRSGQVLDVLSGEAHDPRRWTSMFMTDEFADPAPWAVYGARKAGWDTGDFPLRYSLRHPGDLLCLRDARRDEGPGEDRAHPPAETAARVLPRAGALRPGCADARRPPRVLPGSRGQQRDRPLPDGVATVLSVAI